MGEERHLRILPPPPGASGYFPYQQGWLGADGAHSGRFLL
jgi:hypothetical protein